MINYVVQDGFPHLRATSVCPNVLQYTRAYLNHFTNRRGRFYHLQKRFGHCSLLFCNYRMLLSFRRMLYLGECFTTLTDGRDFYEAQMSPNLKFGNESGRISTRFEGLSPALFGFFKSLYLCNCLELVVEISRAFKSEQTRSFPQLFS